MTGQSQKGLALEVQTRWTAKSSTPRTKNGGGAFSLCHRGTLHVRSLNLCIEVWVGGRFDVASGRLFTRLCQGPASICERFKGYTFGDDM